MEIDTAIDKRCKHTDVVYTYAYIWMYVCMQVCIRIDICVAYG